MSLQEFDLVRKGGEGAPRGGEGEALQEGAQLEPGAGSRSTEPCCSSCSTTGRMPPKTWPEVFGVGQAVSRSIDRSVRQCIGQDPRQGKEGLDL